LGEKKSFKPEEEANHLKHEEGGQQMLQQKRKEGRDREVDGIVPPQRVSPPRLFVRETLKGEWGREGWVREQEKATTLLVKQVFLMAE